MTNVERRYSIISQMREYDRMQVQWMPYLMFFHSSGYLSEVVNTDVRGFRISHKGNEPIANFPETSGPPVSLVVGGSTAFGIGATNDGKTIPSFLNDMTDDLWLNFGGRALSSTQEFLLFLFYHGRLRNIRRVVILSGINSLSLIHLSRGYLKEIGPFFHWNRFQRAMEEPPLSLKRHILKTFFYPFRGDRIDYASASFGELLAGIFGKGRRIPQDEGMPETHRISDDPEVKREDLLHVLERDIRNWRLICGALDIEITFLLQPLANWIPRTLSEEEKALFAILDGQEDNVWKVLRDHMGDDQYRWFSGQLGRICRSHGVPFYDLNEILSKKGLDGVWLFVDRIHLTDEGNRVVADIIQKEIAT